MKKPMDKKFEAGELNLSYFHTYYPDKVLYVKDRKNDVLVQLDTLSIRIKKSPVNLDPYTVVGENAFMCNYCNKKILGNRGAVKSHLKHLHGKEVK